MSLLFPPKAVRDGNRLRKRLQNEAQKTYDKYKLTEEQLEADKLKLLSKAAKEETSDHDDKAIYDFRGLYFADLQTADATNGDETDSAHSGTSVYFKSAFANKLYSKFISSDKSRRLTWKQFICFALMIQIPIGFINRHIHLVHAWGALMVLMIYITIGVVISIPVYMIYMFLGNYTRRSYIRYWDAVPMLKGLAYSIAMSSLYLEVFNIAVTSMAGQYIALMFSWSIPWTTCDFPESSSECVNLNYTGTWYHNHTKKCCLMYRESNCTADIWNLNSLKFGAYDFYFNSVLRYGYGDTPHDDEYLSNIFVFIIMAWCIVFFLSVIGLRRYAKVVTGINLAIFASFIPISLFTFVISPNYTMIKSMKTNFTALRSYLLWVETGIHILHRELPADVLTISAASKPGISTTVDTVIIYSMKLLFVTIYTLWMSLAVNFLQKKYRVSDNNCINARGDVLLFAVFPDVISRLPVPQLWLIFYFFAIYLWGICTTTYIYSSFLDAFLEEYPGLNKWRVVVSAVLCMVAGISTIFLMTPNVFNHYDKWVARIIVNQKGTILFLSLLGLFLYSINRVKNDYHFYLGAILGTYWINGLKLAMLLITLSAIGLVFYRANTGLYGGNWIVLVILAPTIIGIVIAALRYSLRISKTLISPNVHWGPPNRRQKLARIRFDPTHDLRYRSISHRCDHTCLLHSPALKKEMKYWFGKRQQIIQSRERSTEEEDEILNTNFENEDK